MLRSGQRNCQSGDGNYVHSAVLRSTSAEKLVMLKGDRALRLPGKPGNRLAEYLLHRDRSLIAAEQEGKNDRG